MVRPHLLFARRKLTSTVGTHCEKRKKKGKVTSPSKATEILQLSTISNLRQSSRTPLSTPQKVGRRLSSDDRSLDIPSYGLGPTREKKRNTEKEGTSNGDLTWTTTARDGVKQFESFRDRRPHDGNISEPTVLVAVAGGWGQQSRGHMETWALVIRCSPSALSGQNLSSKNSFLLRRRALSTLQSLIH